MRLGLSMALPSKCVVDTCAILDLEAGCFLRPFLARTEARVPDILEEELRPDLWQDIQRWGVRVEGLSGAEIAEISELSNVWRGLSIYDWSVILVARRESVPVVTNNYKHIPKAACAMGVKHIGVLGVIEGLVNARCVDPPAALCGLEAIRKAGSYLPEDTLARLEKRFQRMCR